MANISPGVYTSIIDLSTYVQAVPSTIGFICALSEKGEDNKLRFVGGRSELIGEWGEPNISTYGKYYGQGPYHAYNYLGESSALYFMRCLPEDAAYANLRIDAVRSASDATADIQVKYIGSAQAYNELETGLEKDGDRYPVCLIYPIGRGSYYNKISIRFTEHSNPTLFGVYVMDVYEKQSDGSDAIIESFEVSFDPTSKDNAGESNWIVNVLENYSSMLRATMTLPSGDYTEGHKMVTKVYDQNIGDVTVNESPASLTDTKQDFFDWAADSTDASQYTIIVKDPKGNTIWGWIGEMYGEDNESVEIWDGRDLTTASRGWNGSLANFDFTAAEFEYQVRKSAVSIASGFTSATPVPLKKGSEGSLINAAGELDTDTATQVLSEGYAGLLDDQVLDQENIYYSMVFDCGYPDDVKNEIASLVQTRRDCVAINGNGDNPSFSDAIDERQNNHTWNTFLVAIYENYSKVYDVFTGQDMWVSPTYHMSYLLPRNDQVGEIWTAPAGLTRGMPEGVKDIRYNPRLGQRDQLYLNQLNPIIKLNEGYTVWGQLTSQSKPSKLQSLNVVRLILYAKRALEQYARYFIFEQNDAVTWSEVQGDVAEFLERLKRGRGLRAYNVSVGATNYELKIKTFHINVELFPVQVAEKIELNFFIK